MIVLRWKSPLRWKGEKDLLIKAPLNPNHAPFPPQCRSVPPRPKGVFIRKGFQRDVREGDWRLFASHTKREGEVGSWKNHESHPSRWSSGPPTLMGPRDVFTRDGTTCTDAYPDLGRLALFNAAPSFPRPRPFYLMREGRKYLTPLSLSLSPPCHAYTSHAHDEKTQRELW